MSNGELRLAGEEDVRRHGQGLVRSARAPVEWDNAADVLDATALPVIATVDFAPYVASDDRRGTSRISAALTQPKRQSGHAS